MRDETRKEDFYEYKKRFVISFNGSYFICCISRSPVLSAELAPIKFGISTDFTGPNAEAGKFTYQGVTLAIEEANAKGGINGRKIAHIVLDDASDPAKGVSNAKRLIELEKVPAIIGILQYQFHHRNIKGS